MDKTLLAGGIEIAPLSICRKGATIGNNTKIWHFCNIVETAVIGRDCMIGDRCYIAGNIGDRCKIQNGVNVFKGVYIHDDVFVGPGVTFTNVLRPRSFINQKDNFKTTIIQKGVTIGANATIVCGVTIGEYAFIGAGTVVTRDILPYTLVVGNPAKIVGKVCRNGHRLNTRDTIDECPECKQ